MHGTCALDDQHRDPKMAAAEAVEKPGDRVAGNPRGPLPSSIATRSIARTAGVSQESPHGRLPYGYRSAIARRLPYLSKSDENAVREGPSK
jgi:hypothetical protein